MKKSGAGVDTADGAIVAITLRNSSATGPTMLRFGYEKIWYW